MDQVDVTSDWMSEILRSEVEVVSTARIGDGLVGMNMRVILAGGAGIPKSVVIKLPSADPTSRATGIGLRNYEREVKFYLQVADTVEVRTPHCFYGEWDEATGDFALMLEDMTPAEQGDQVAGCDLRMAELAVVELAKLHGPRWDDPILHDLDWLTRRTGPDDAAQLGALWKMFFPGFEATYARHLCAEALALAERFGPCVAAWVEAGRVRWG